MALVWTKLQVGYPLVARSFGAIAIDGGFCIGVDLAEIIHPKRRELLHGGGADDGQFTRDRFVRRVGNSFDDDGWVWPQGCGSGRLLGGWWLLRGGLARRRERMKASGDG